MYDVRCTKYEVGLLNWAKFCSNTEGVCQLDSVHLNQ